MRRRNNRSLRELVAEAIPPYPTADEIASRAHEMLQGGGHTMADLRASWLLAEQELLERAAARVIRRAEATTPEPNREPQG